MMPHGNLTTAPVIAVMLAVELWNLGSTWIPHRPR